MQHVPSTREVIKMDAYTKLYSGVCSCGWKSQGIETWEPRALKSAQAHADAMNARAAQQ